MQMTEVPFDASSYQHLSKKMDFEKAISFDELYKAGKQCCRNIRWKDSTAGYEHNLVKNTHLLRDEILSGKYKISPYQYFKVHEPKERLIVATRIKDRQLQRSLCNNGFYDDMVRSFVADNCACQVGRGVDYALKRMKRHLRRYNAKYGRSGWVLNCDVHHFFESIDHDVAKRVVAKRVKDEWTQRYVFDIIDSFGERGIGLGSQMSQLIALAMLDDLDHYIKERLGAEFYLRYMDDLVIISDDKDFLVHCRDVIRDKLKAIGLVLNKKTKIYPLKQGVNFLKWRFRITESGAIIQTMSKSKLGRQRRKLKKIYSKERNGEYPTGSGKQSLICWEANARRGNTFYTRKRMKAYFNNLYNTEAKKNGSKHLYENATRRAESTVYAESERRIDCYGSGAGKNSVCNRREDWL